MFRRRWPSRSLGALGDSQGSAHSSRLNMRLRSTGLADDCITLPLSCEDDERASCRIAMPARITRADVDDQVSARRTMHVMSAGLCHAQPPACLRRAAQV